MGYADTFAEAVGMFAIGFGVLILLALLFAAANIGKSGNENEEENNAKK